jgi:hypothetical protein
MAEAIDDVAGIGDRQPILGEWGAGDVAAQSLEAIPLARADADGGVE